MEAKDVEQLLRQNLPECEVQVESDGRHVRVIAVGECFAGLKKIPRHQLIYGALREPLAENRIHAVNIETYTPAEWEQRQV